MSRLRAFLVALALVVTCLVLSSTPANASIGKPCGSPRSTTNSWHFFYSKKLRLTTATCRYNSMYGPRLTYVRTPGLTYPSAWPIPSQETVKTTHGMRLYSSRRSHGLVRAVWRWSSKSCAAEVICNSFDFSFTVDAVKGTRICAIGGSCDKWDSWA